MFEWLVEWGNTHVTCYEWTALSDLKLASLHDDVIKWEHFPRYWPLVREIHRSPVNSPRKGQWRGALMFSLIRVWINGWANNREAGDLWRHRVRYDVIVMVRDILVPNRHDANFVVADFHTHLVITTNCAAPASGQLSVFMGITGICVVYTLHMSFLWCQCWEIVERRPL